MRQELAAREASGSHGGGGGGGAPDVMVVQTDAAGGSHDQQVSANVTVETTKPVQSNPGK